MGFLCLSITGKNTSFSSAAAAELAPVPVLTPPLDGSTARAGLVDTEGAPAPAPGLGLTEVDEEGTCRP